MSVEKVAKEFTEALKTGDFAKAESYWADDVVSIEAQTGDMAEVRGKEAVHGKGEWWTANHEVHRFDTRGPYLNASQFALHFSMDITRKQSGERITMDEVALYTVRDGKVVEERFFY
jgi:ketosteroid isomerase-like protein